MIDFACVVQSTAHDNGFAGMTVNLAEDKHLDGREPNLNDYATDN